MRNVFLVSFSGGIGGTGGGVRCEAFYPPHLLTVPWVLSHLGACTNRAHRHANSCTQSLKNSLGL